MKLSILLLAAFSCIKAQFKDEIPTLSKELLLKYTYDINWNSENSKGYQLIENILSENDYFVLGEFHFSENIQILASRLLKMGSTLGYTDFVVENGRYSTYVLNGIIKESNNIEDSLRKFLANNSLVLEDGGELERNLPIPFLTEKQEVQVLNAIKEYNYNMLGIDQEFCYSTRMFLKLIKQKTEVSQSEIAKGIEVLDSLEKRDLEDGFNLCKAILESEIIVELMKKYQSTEWGKLYAEWIKSMEIYKRRRHSPRIDFMREMFCEQVNERLSDNPDLKMFVKMGALHTSKGPTPWFGIYDIGELVQKMAIQRDKKSVHVFCSNRYFYDKEKLIDRIEGKKDLSENIFKSLAAKDQWRILDIKALRKLYKKGLFCIPEGAAYSDIKHDIMFNDYLILMPADRGLINL